MPLSKKLPLSTQLNPAKSSPMTLLMLCAILMLSSCVKQVRVLLPQDKYLQPCPVTYLPSQQSSNKQVASAGAANIGSLGDCNDDKAALRAWKATAAKSKVSVNPDTP